MPKHPSPTTSHAQSDPRWTAVMTRDAKEDGTFFYAVKTTGVYCRPSCASRAAKPKNVVFFNSAIAAEKAGFRACLRCDPTSTSTHDQRVAQVAALCRLIETSAHPPTLETLAQHVGLSTFYLQRIFKAITGVTPKQYGKALQAERLRHQMGASTSVTETMLDVGYKSAGQFYDESKSRLGMTPTAYQKRGKNETIHYALGMCSLSHVLVAHTAQGICAIFLGDDADLLVADLSQRFRNAKIAPADEAFQAQVDQVVALIASPHIGLALPLDIRGTAFQERVWRALMQIPLGDTRTYSEIAEAIGSPSAVRAVASACGANPISVAIPCHRVVRSNGDLSGYRWGVHRKRLLLDRES